MTKRVAFVAAREICFVIQNVAAASRAIIDRTAGVRCGGEDCPLVGLQHLEPAIEVTCVVVA